MVRITGPGFSIGPRVLFAALGVGLVAAGAFGWAWQAGLIVVGAVVAAAALFGEFNEWPSSTESGSAGQ